MAAVGAFTSMDQAEDLKAFERRLVEHINNLGPKASFWKVVVLITFLVTAFTASQWALDQQTVELSFWQSLWNHPSFFCSIVAIFILFLLGVHKRIVIKTIMLTRCRNVLEDFNMSCDEIGRLILKPRPKEMDIYQRLYNPGHG
ncbi:nuclear envelope phosphatase-regulatory subunit 1-like [Clytia hemisphaerica]|uniref:Transmembrane protein 188 n=1 Tax=Clytia hemisphaerica TaxID=252671 RepID=A0A7M5WTB3_9CNID